MIQNKSNLFPESNPPKHLMFHLAPELNCASMPILTFNCMFTFFWLSNYLSSHLLAHVNDSIWQYWRWSALCTIQWFANFLLNTLMLRHWPYCSRKVSANNETMWHKQHSNNLFFLLKMSLQQTSQWSWNVQVKTFSSTLSIDQWNNHAKNNFALILF